MTAGAPLRCFGEFRSDEWTPALGQRWEHFAGSPTFVGLGVDLSPLDALKAEIDPGECAHLLELRWQRSLQEQRIRHEARDWRSAVAEVFDTVGLDLDDPRNLDLLLFGQAISEALDEPVYGAKALFKRRRPRNCCPPHLEPMFPPGHLRHPGHPAFPSGHATLAHFWAGLLGTHYVRDQAALDRAAAAVAWRREVAGLHYPSDSVAGRLLAQTLVLMLLSGGAAGHPLRQDWEALIPTLP